MTVFEMHLQVNQRLQEIASYKRDKFRPEEIDIALNKAMFRLLEKGIDKKFEDSQVNLAHVVNLVNKTRSRDVILPQTTDPVYEEGVLTTYSVLPADFYWLINSRVEIFSDRYACNTAPTLATTTITEYVAVVPFPALDAAPYFDNVSVLKNGVITIYTSPSQIVAGFNSPNSKYIVIQNILEYFYRTPNNLSVYWERYRDVYYKDSFIFVSTTPYTSMAVISGGSTSSTTATTTSYTIYNRALMNGITTGLTNVTSTTNKEQSILYDAISNNQYYNTRKVQPLLTQTADYLIYYPDESFLITRAYIDYIRKPRTISLVLNQSCELSDTVHPKLIDTTIELLRLDTKDQSYPATVEDTQISTN